MRAILALTGKDLLQTGRDRLAALFTFILPILFTVFFGFLFGSSGSDRLPVALLNLDDGAPAQSLITTLERGGMVELRPYSAVQRLGLEEAVQKDNVAAGLIIPQGFGSASDANVPSAPAIVVGKMGSSGSQSVMQSVRSAVDRVLGARAATAAALAALDLDSSPGSAEFQGGLAVSEAAYEHPTVTVIAEDAGTEAGRTPRGFDLSSPGMLVNWILFSLLTAAVALVQERKTGALRRLLTTRVRGIQIIAGKTGAMLCITLTQQVVLIGLGQFVLGVDYLRNPPALLLAMFSLSLLAASLGLMLATILRSEQAVISATVIISMVLAAMGGAWFPLEITGSTFAAIGHVTPAAWVLDAFRGVILQGQGVLQVLPGLAVVWGYALLFFAVAVWRFRFE
ncbi:MAG: ABC transporter permease [Gaiellales bacterium]|nr:ABC transporter permease [Gaiellales bacterium]